MTLSVRDAAAMLSVIAGRDPADPATAEADAHKADFVAALSPVALKGKRIGVLRDRIGTRADIAALFDAALKQMADLGATIVEIEVSQAGLAGGGEDDLAVLMSNSKAHIAVYLGGMSHNAVRMRSG